MHCSGEKNTGWGINIGLGGKIKKVGESTIFPFADKQSERFHCHQCHMLQQGSAMPVEAISRLLDLTPVQDGTSCSLSHPSAAGE
jgi:hypothetical protein